MKATTYCTKQREQIQIHHQRNPYCSLVYFIFIFICVSFVIWFKAATNCLVECNGKWKSETLQTLWRLSPDITQVGQKILRKPRQERIRAAWQWVFNLATAGRWDASVSEIEWEGVYYFFVPFSYMNAHDHSFVAHIVVFTVVDVCFSLYFF